MNLFARSDIERSFERTIISRGADYLRTGQVLNVWIDEEGDLCGTVRGSSRRPYTVVISIIPKTSFVYLDSGCSCPYSDQCKHGAAVALYALTHEVECIEADDEDEAEPVDQFAIPHVLPVSVEIPVPREVKEWLSQVETATVDASEFDPAAKSRVFYVLGTKPTTGGLEVPTVTAVNRTILKAGGFGATTDIKNGAITGNNLPKHWTWFDSTLLTDLHMNASRLMYDKAEFRLDGRHGVRLLREILRSERCTWQDGRLLQLGAPRTGKLVWQELRTKGSLQPTIAFGGDGKAIATTDPWYVDLTTQECGPLDCGMSPELAAALIRASAIGVEHVPAVYERLAALGVAGDALPATAMYAVVRAPDPVPCFHVDFESCKKKAVYWGAPQASTQIPFGKLTFEYEGLKAPADNTDVRVVEGDKVLILRRNPAAERAASDFLQRFGWRDPTYCGWEIPAGRTNSLCMVPPDSTRLLEPIERVSEFATTAVPKLITSGWKIDVAQNFRVVPDMAVEWDIALESSSGIDWFEFQLGIRVEGQPYDLKPVLAQLFKEHGNSVHGLGAGAKNQQSDHMIVFGVGGRAIRLSRKRLSAILQPLVELFGGVPEWPEELRLPKAMLPETAKFVEGVGSAGVPWKSSDELKRLGERFATFDHLEPLTEPEGFKGELRGYQREGLAWLQFLREYGFGGILADDMGLGKTVQVLAHIQTEKQAGRLDRPCLIVAPTSTMPNWRRECERFAPDLKVLTLQGAGRAEKFAELNGVDIALTTYPLLARDKDQLLKSSYHMVVLDEAQYVKNPVTAAAKAARELVARHRLCLSGTPVENHLGELWALIHFLMPGFLGSDQDFKKRFRTPIEKSGDKVARERLSRRIRPFMLRRTKSQVVKELPPKTEVIETIAFDDPQRDLYESIRIAMDEQVRKLIASQGFDKSRIQILDALLKLRQVCCDPRLVKLESAKEVTVSAKLDRLMEMLGVLIEDGRRVLLFSQFTSMLNLIEERLRTDGIQWVRISGDTVDRETPVKRFQGLEVPLFLISLKAGGTGLNLTAADTVILYDPWWNPAVENQAIDRAHRIGQDKAVMVYKMVAAGTIEEKMLEMQARKGDIARSILTDDAEGIRTLTADDLRWVLSKD